MSRPSNCTLPASGVSSPVIRLNSVDLPAPFGPITLTSSPSEIDRSTPFTAVSPPKRRVTPRTSRRVCVMCAPSYRSQQTLRPEPHQQQQCQAVDQHPVVSGPAENLRQADQRDRADDAAQHVTEAAEYHHRQGEDGYLRIESLVVDVAI